MKRWHFFSGFVHTGTKASALWLKLLIVAAFFVSISAMAARKQETSIDLPSVGHRKYVIDGEPFAPVRIKDIRAVDGKVYLKDPTQPGSAIKPAPAPPLPRHAPKPGTRPAHLTFRKMAVEGKKAEPRVKFEREDLRLGRVDEPVSQDFLPKVFEAATGNGF